MQLTCRFPEDISGKTLVDEAIAAVEAALQPEELPTVDLRAVPVYLSAAKRGRMAPLLEQTGLKEKDGLERMAYAWRLRNRKIVRNAARGDAPSSDSQRKKAFENAIQSGIDQGQIVLGEAGTGYGKSRILGRAAKYILCANKTNVVWVAAPTISVLLHLIREFKEVDRELSPAVILGRQHFVSARRFCELSEEMSQDGNDVSDAIQKVIDWLSRGAPPVSDHSREMAKLIPGLSHLHEDLAEIAPELANCDCALLEKDVDEPAEAIRQQLLDRAADSRLVFCTHMMLVLESIRTPKEVSLPFTHVLVDEAHELESVAAALALAEVSLHSLRCWFRKAGLSRANEATGLINETIDSLRNNPKLRSAGFLPPDVGQRVHKALRKVDKILSGARNGNAAERKEYHENIGKLLRGGEGWTRIFFSPTRRYPRLMYGPSSVGYTLDGIWQRVKAAVLVSATIYVPDFSGGVGSGYMRAKLSIPKERASLPAPASANWVTAVPTLMLPSDGAAAAFCYPGAVETDEGDDAEQSDAAAAYQQWLDTCAGAIAKGARSAKGGTLVLCNSFSDIEELRVRLSVPLRNRLIAHRRGVSTQTQKQEFVRTFREGVKPVWLATGAAWTGLDLRDGTTEPAGDFLLTDLFVVRTPFGMARTSTQEGRRRSFGWFSADFWEATIRLRQGLGRLMRCDGVSDRRIWMLDGRLFSRSHARFHPVKTVLNGYAKRAHFEA